ncbi:MAG: AsmA family protein, partial [Rhizobiales bacterium]|nr:AsmA family protein [Hyphomicrobiales bacterium]
VIVRDQSGRADETFEDVGLSVAWPSISKSFTATGQFTWRGEKIDATLSLSDFLAALTGERSGLKARIVGAPLKLAFDGHIGHRPALKLEGMLAADGPSLRHVLEWAGIAPLPGGGFGRFALKAQTNLVGQTIAFSGVNVELDGNAAEGVFSLTTGGRPQLQGTLAAEEIDISPYVSAMQVLSSEREWSRLPIRLDGLKGMELDVRLSAGRVMLAGTRIGRTALSANLRGGRFVLTIGESQAFDGVVKGTIGIAGAADDAADLKANLQFTGVDLEKCLFVVLGVRKVEGRGDIALALDATGSDVFELARTLNGTGSLVAKQGALVGVNVEQVLRRLERRPLSGGGDFRSGRTPFEKLGVV